MVGPCGQGIEDIHYLEDPGRERDRLALEAVRVARPVLALVVLADDGPDRLEGPEGPADLLPEKGVALNHQPLRGHERARLQENGVGDRHRLVSKVLRVTHQQLPHEGVIVGGQDPRPTPYWLLTR
jgi:hypothetical protein